MLRNLPVPPIERSIRVGGKCALLRQLVKFIVRHSLSVTVPALLMLYTRHRWGCLPTPKGAGIREMPSPSAGLPTQRMVVGDHSICSGLEYCDSTPAFYLELYLRCGKPRYMVAVPRSQKPDVCASPLGVIAQPHSVEPRKQLVNSRQ